MTEKEKMLAGQLYDPSDPELNQLRLKARKLTADEMVKNETIPVREEKKKAFGTFSVTESLVCYGYKKTLETTVSQKSL